MRPPLGVVVPVLPPAYATVWAAGMPYHYANAIYYVAVPEGYAVAQPPLDPSVAPPPQGAVAPAPAGNWTYCDSAKAYYPPFLSAPKAGAPCPPRRRHRNKASVRQ